MSILWLPADAYPRPNLRGREAMTPPMPTNETPNLAREVFLELDRAQALHAPMHGPHEGYAVILEELDELWDEVKARRQDRMKMRKEAMQVAAMALRFISDVCDR